MNEKTKIYVVFKTHFDIGYTELAKEVVERFSSSMLSDVISTCEGTQKLGKDKQYVWTMPAWPLVKALDPEYTDQKLLDKAKQLIRQGQIAWHVLPFTTHTEFCGLEEYIRGMCFSKQLSDEYQKWPISAKMTDVPGHTWILPSLLHKAGVKFLHLGCNPGCKSPDVPMLFFWEGPDGGRVLTFYNKGFYGSSLIPPKDWPFPVWLALMQTNDNIGPQGPEIIEQINEVIMEEMPESTVVVGTMDDFYNALIQYPMDEIPVIRGDLADTWIHGVGTYPREVGIIRNTRSIITDAEKVLSIGTLCKLIGDDDINKCKMSIHNAFENSILFGEHTWGLDVKTTMGHNRHYRKKDFIKNRNTPLYQRMEASWEEQRQRADLAGREACSSARFVMDILTESVNIEGERIVVFNGLGWKRDSWIDLENLNISLRGRMIIDEDTGEILKTTLFNGKLAAFVKRIPALGYKTLILKDEAGKETDDASINCDATRGLLENTWFRIEADPLTGTIRSIIDKLTGKQWVDSSKPYGFGQYQYDIYGIDDVTEFIRSYTYRFYDWLVNDLGRLDYPHQEHLSFVPKEYSIKTVRDKGYGSLVMETVIKDQSYLDFGNASKLALTVTLYEDQPWIDFAYTLTGKEATSYIEAGHFVFPININKPEIHINKLGSVLNPAIDIVKDSNNLLYCCENWVDVSDGESGLAFIPFDTPLFSVGKEGIYKFRGEYVKDEPVLIFNAFNNSWGTNFPQWIEGDLTFKYRIIPHKGDWQIGNIASLALESMTPVLTGYSKGNDSGFHYIPQQMEFIGNIHGMTVTALKPSDDKKGYILRLREIIGEGRKVQIRLNCTPSAIVRCDFFERLEDEVEITEGGFIFETAPFEIHSFYLRYF